MKKLLSILMIIVLVFSIGCKKDKDKDKVLNPIQDSSIVPGYEEYYTDESDTDTIVVVDTVKPNNNVMVEDNQGNLKPATNDDLSQSQKTFYIIVGSYQNIKNAQKRADYFTKLGYKAEVLPINGTYNRVSISKYSDETSARNDLKKYRTQFGDKSFWLLLR